MFVFIIIERYRVHRIPNDHIQVATTGINTMKTCQATWDTTAMIPKSCISAKAKAPSWKVIDVSVASNQAIESLLFKQECTREERPWSHPQKTESLEPKHSSPCNGWDSDTCLFSVSSLHPPVDIINYLSLDSSIRFTSAEIEKHTKVFQSINHLSHKNIQLLCSMDTCFLGYTNIWLMACKLLHAS